MASIHVSPQLLLSTSAIPPPSSLSQCNSTYSLSLCIYLSMEYYMKTRQVVLNSSVRWSVASGGLDLRYPANGSDLEPWRCKRTDGKKWRCSRDVAPDQKYCERHAHNNRPRSRKHVEISPHNLFPKSSPTLPRSTTAQFPYDQTKCIEWLMRGANSNSNSNGEGIKQQVMYKNGTTASVYHPHFTDGSKIDTADQTTRFFIDAISGKGDEKKQWPSLALSLSICEGGDEKGDLGMGMMMKNQWVNPISWMNSGGPNLASGPPTVVVAPIWHLLLVVMAIATAILIAAAKMAAMHSISLGDAATLLFLFKD